MKSNMKSFWGKLPARWRQHQVHTICWACFVFRSIRVKKLNWSKPREQWAVLCQQQHFLFQSCQPSSPWSLFLTWPHTHYFFLPLLILVFWTFFFSSVGLHEEGWGFLTAVGAARSPVREEHRELMYCFTTQGPCVAVSSQQELWAWYACAEHLVLQDTHLEKGEVVSEGLGTARWSNLTQFSWKENYHDVPVVWVKHVYELLLCRFCVLKLSLKALHVSLLHKSGHIYSSAYCHRPAGQNKSTSLLSQLEGHLWADRNNTQPPHNPTLRLLWGFPTL